MPSITIKRLILVFAVIYAVSSVPSEAESGRGRNIRSRRSIDPQRNRCSSDIRRKRSLRPVQSRSVRHKSRHRPDGKANSYRYKKEHHKKSDSKFHLNINLGNSERYHNSYRRGHGITHRRGSIERAERFSYKRTGHYKNQHRCHGNKCYRKHCRDRWRWKYKRHGHHYGSIVYYRHKRLGYGWSYIRPKYHRKYIFVSIGGYWPSSYSYRRYYWYGWHPERWFGSSPDVYVIKEGDEIYYSDTTYQSYPSVQPSYSYDSSGNVIPDYEAFEKVREKMSADDEKSNQPEKATVADKYFEKAVEHFADENYSLAREYIEDAMRRDEEDVILPFVYCQSLFAEGEYSKAASALKTALNNLPEDDKSILFPRGLYEDEDILDKQIEELAKAAEREYFNSDLKLLLGYQFLGVGNYSRAEDNLLEAIKDYPNRRAGETLLELLNYTIR